MINKIWENTKEFLETAAIMIVVLIVEAREWLRDRWLEK